VNAPDMVRTVEPVAVLTIRTLVRSCFAAYAMLASKRGCSICASGTELSCVLMTSNVDGQFQKAGFDTDRILEIHGSIHRLQCTVPCCPKLWSADSLQVSVDAAALHATSALPFCPRCGAVARPNILMFGDRSWISHASDYQESAFESWLRTLGGKRLVIIECGAGTAIPSIRWISGNVAEKSNSPLIRINPREAQVLPGQFSIPTGALEGLSLLFRLG
jgi:NAD-dependent SIR2 family protein deacetylase